MNSDEFHQHSIFHERLRRWWSFNCQRLRFDLPPMTEQIHPREESTNKILQHQKFLSSSTYRRCLSFFNDDKHHIAAEKHDTTSDDKNDFKTRSIELKSISSRYIESSPLLSFQWRKSFCLVQPKWQQEEARDVWRFISLPFFFKENNLSRNIETFSLFLLSRRPPHDHIPLKDR